MEDLNCSSLFKLSSPSGLAIPVPDNLIGNSSSSAIIGAEILPRIDPVLVRAGPSGFHFPAPRNLLMVLAAVLARSYPASEHRQVVEGVEQEGRTRSIRSLGILAEIYSRIGERNQGKSQRQSSRMQII